MKRYNASYTIEAAVITCIVAMIIVYVILEGMYVTDSQIARNICVIEGISNQQRHYYYQNSKGQLDVNKKLSDSIIRMPQLYTTGLNRKLNNSLIWSEVYSTSVDKRVTGITVSANIKFSDEDRLFPTMNISESVSDTDATEFVRIVNALVKEKR